MDNFRDRFATLALNTFGDRTQNVTLVQYPFKGLFLPLTVSPSDKPPHKRTNPYRIPKAHHLSHRGYPKRLDEIVLLRCPPSSAHASNPPPNRQVIPVGLCRVLQSPTAIPPPAETPLTYESIVRAATIPFLWFECLGFGCKPCLGVPCQGGRGQATWGQAPAARTTRYGSRPTARRGRRISSRQKMLSIIELP